MAATVNHFNRDPFTRSARLHDMTNFKITSLDNRGNPSMSFLKELWEFMQVRKKYWLAPIVLSLLVFGGLIILAQGSAIAPFIYTLF
jgi:Family of unknown function (DUF5989)